MRFHSFVCSVFWRKEEILAVSVFNLDTCKLSILIIRVILDYVVKSKSKWSHHRVLYFDYFWKFWSLPFTLNNWNPSEGIIKSVALLVVNIWSELPQSRYCNDFRWWGKNNCLKSTYVNLWKNVWHKEAFLMCNDYYLHACHRAKHVVTDNV